MLADSECGKSRFACEYFGNFHLLDWIPVGCSDTCAHAYRKFQRPGILECEECNTDMCNKKKGLI